VLRVLALSWRRGNLNQQASLQDALFIASLHGLLQADRHCCPAGVAAAVAANMPCIGITSGHAAAALKAAGTCHTIQSYLDLMPLTRS